MLLLRILHLILLIVKFHPDHFNLLLKFMQAFLGFLVDPLLVGKLLLQRFGVLCLLFFYH